MQHRSGSQRNKQQEAGQGIQHPEAPCHTSPTKSSQEPGVGCGETGTVVLFQVRKLSAKDPHQPGFHIKNTWLRALSDQGHQGSMRKTGQQFALVQHFLLDKPVRVFGEEQTGTNQYRGGGPRALLRVQSLGKHWSGRGRGG